MYLQLLLWSLASRRLNHSVFTFPESVAEYVLHNLVGERPHRKAGKSLLYSKHQFLSKHSTVIKMISTALSTFPFISEYQHIILKSLLFIHKGLLLLVSTYVLCTWTLNSTNTEAKTHWRDLVATALLHCYLGMYRLDEDNWHARLCAPNLNWQTHTGEKARLKKTLDKPKFNWSWCCLFLAETHRI